MQKERTHRQGVSFSNRRTERQSNQADQAPGSNPPGGKSSWRARCGASGARGRSSVKRLEAKSSETVTQPATQVSPKSRPTKTKEQPVFADQYRAGNVKGLELFSVKTEKRDTFSETETEIVKPYYAYVRVNGKRLKMEVDTGAAVSVISEKLYKRRFKKSTLVSTNCVLKTYSEQSLRLKGKISVTVSCNEKKYTLSLLVVQGNGPALLGRDWIKMLKLDWSTVNRVKTESTDELCDRYSEVFNPSLGKVKGVKAKLHVVPDAIPKFCKPRPVPYALREAVDVQ